MVADLEELETMDASEIYSKRLNAKEVIFPQKGEFTFPIADGRIKTPGEDQALRTSTLIRPRPNRGEGHIDFLGESEGSFPQTHDSFPVAGEAMNDFWSMSGSFIHRHHVEPRVALYSPREESFPIPLKYIDVTRTTHTNLDVKQEKRIDDYWNIDGSRDLSDPWTGFTQFTLLEEKPPVGYMWSGERLTRKQVTSRPDHLWPELWKSMGKHAKLKEKQENLFSSRRWTNQNPWRRSGPENIHLDTATSNSRRKSQDFLGESEGFLPPPHDSLPDAGEAMNDFWSMSGNFIYRHHVEPRVKLYSPREESFPFPLKYTDVDITLNPESHFTRREKNHSLFH